MKVSQLAAGLSFAIAASCFVAQVYADNINIDKVIGSAVVGSIESGSNLQVAGNLETVNGEIRPGTAASIGTVNGDITLDNSEPANATGHT